MSPKSRRDANSSDASEHSDRPTSGERLQKVLAAAGVASRRECETLILEGRVEVDRQVVTVLGTRVDPARQEIRVDGTPLGRRRFVYFVVNKPAGVVSTNRDPDGRPRVVDLVPSDERLFTVGRLDRSSEGMILVTNDGELANQLSHPRYGMPKTYRAKVLGLLTPEATQQLRQGVHLAEGLARVASLKVKGRHARGSELEIILTEGRNREIRRVLARVGHKVLYLKRIAIGPLRLGNLATGDCRRLKPDEVEQLRQYVRRIVLRAGAEGGEPPVARRPSAAKGVTGKRGRRPAKSPSTGRHVAEHASTRKRTVKKKVASSGGTGGKKAPGKAFQGGKSQTTGSVLDYDAPAPSGSSRRSSAGKKKSAGKRKRR